MNPRSPFRRCPLHSNIFFVKIKRFPAPWACLFLFFGGNVFSVPPLDLLKDLEAISPLTPPGQWLVLTGKVEGYRVARPGGDRYEVDLVLIKATWENEETIRTWRGLIRFRGRDFEAIFPQRVRADSPPPAIPPGSRVMVLARHLGWSEERGLPTFEGVQVRRLNF